jgi:hypothetical protein
MPIGTLVVVATSSAPQTLKLRAITGEASVPMLSIVAMGGLVTATTWASLSLAEKATT